MAPDAVEIRPLAPDDGKAVAAMLNQVYDEQAAPGQKPAGIAGFRAYATAEAIVERAKTHGTYVAWDGARPVGVIEVRDSSQVTLLFVKAAHSDGPGGYAVALSLVVRAEEACRAAGRTAMTVSASPATQAFYHRLGFVPAAKPQAADGLAFVIMEKKL
jgi:hypothetical protein